MTFQLDQVVPWGRSYEEYVAMFSLDEMLLQGGILGCADGPASFNAELTRRGGEIVSVDPLYACDVDQIRERGRTAMSAETHVAQAGLAHDNMLQRGRTAMSAETSSARNQLSAAPCFNGAALR